MLLTVKQEKIIDACGHWPMIEWPDEVRKHLLAMRTAPVEHFPELAATQYAAVASSM